MTTTNKWILLAGKGPLFTELKELFESKSYGVVSQERIEEYPNSIQFAVEVSNYDLDVKKAVVQSLDHVLAPDIPIITTSLAITATEVASWTRHPERICGFGTFVPVAERNVLEIAPALQTSIETLEQTEKFFQSLGKNTAVVEDEVGLVFPRVLSLIINEAVFTVMEGTATPEDIDIAMKKGTNYPYGPLEWADQVGLDEVYSVIRGLHRDLAEERYRPAPLLRKMVLAGRLGSRSGQGFYSYQNELATSK
ncbi:3-hydroxyacyl-CoA dehydrogenase family protein [Effusibacillus consociatus]|uniref:3-hydroxyacyl-CoA dehydrogenase family protein n=1 Tax=Effusibacillus consociatus TaxID=1117041 RepID=A0ABV9Q7D7_9BACL